MVPIGSKAPDALVAIRPREWVSLHALFANEPALLLFFPLAFSGTCTRELCTIAENPAVWENAGAKPIAISVDSPYVNVKFAESIGARFPVVSDFNREATIAYDVVRPDLGGLREVSERAVFLIDGNGIIAWNWQGEHPGVLPPFDDIVAAIERLM